MAKKIILVEDDKDLSFLMNKKLTEEGFQVIMAETGQQALEIGRASCRERV